MTSTPDITCRLCGRENIPLDYTQGNKDEYRFHRCPDCRLVNYDLSGGLDQGKYAINWVDPTDASHPRNYKQTLTWEFLVEYQPTPCRLLEIGCGNGRLLHCAKEAGWQVNALELSPVLAEKVSQALGVEVEVADFLSYEVPEDARYDVVVLRHVLEHLPDCLAAMNSMNRLLRPDGLLVMEFPNIDGLDSRVKRWLRKTGLRRHRYPEGYVPGHACEYNRHAFARLLDATGFELVRWETYSVKALPRAFYTRVHIGNKARIVARKR